MASFPADPATAGFGPRRVITHCGRFSSLFGVSKQVTRSTSMLDTDLIGSHPNQWDRVKTPEVAPEVVDRPV